MKYYCKFDDTGKVTAGIADFQLSNFGGIDKLTSDGYVAVDNDTYQYYIGNKGQGKNGTGYVRGADGKPTDAPPIIVTNQQKLDALDAEYQPQFDDLAKNLGLAILNNDTDAQTSIKDDYAALKAEYTNKKGEIENGNS